MGGMETCLHLKRAGWIGRTLFSAKGKLVTLLKLWWNPPSVEHPLLHNTQIDISLSPTDGVRGRFPVLLTHKYACDMSVVALLRSCTLGNSPTALRNTARVTQRRMYERFPGLPHCPPASQTEFGNTSSSCSHLQATLILFLLPFHSRSAWFLAAYV